MFTRQTLNSIRLISTQTSNRTFSISSVQNKTLTDSVKETVKSAAETVC